MRASGIGGVMLFLGKHGYLRNETAWSNMLASIRLAKAAGMQVWVADDNGYPSGMAGGRVVEADPRFEVRVLQSVVKRGKGPVPVRIDLPPRAESFVSATLYPLKDGQPLLAAGRPVPTAGARVETVGLDGEWELHAFALRVNDEGTQAMTTKEGFLTSGRYPNLLDAAAMDAYVEMTHAEYARRLGPLQGQIDVFYGNEPNLMAIWHSGGRRPSGEGYLPWAPDLSRRFRRDHGYDVEPWLPALFRGGSDEARLVRRHFYQTVGDLFSENYTGRIARWAERNGVRSGGHLFIEERMDMQVISEGNFMKAIGDQQIPGCDVPMPDPGKYWNYWMPKFVGSAAQLRGRETVSVLIDPIVHRQTPTLTPKPEEMMRFINMACLMGCNQVTSYIYWDQYPPAVYRAFNEQVGRVCLMLRGRRTRPRSRSTIPSRPFSRSTCRRTRTSLNRWTTTPKPNPSWPRRRRLFAASSRTATISPGSTARPCWQRRSPTANSRSAITPTRRHPAKRGPVAAGGGAHAGAVSTRGGPRALGGRAAAFGRRAGRARGGAGRRGRRAGRKRRGSAERTGRDVPSLFQAARRRCAEGPVCGPLYAARPADDLSREQQRHARGSGCEVRSRSGCDSPRV